MCGFCLSIQDDHSGCFNFLSVYSRFPTIHEDEYRMLVCDTHAGVRQDCHTVEVSRANLPVDGVI